jgi:hypothetical protein
MASPTLEYTATAAVLLIPAVGGVYVGMGGSAAVRVRALSASAFLLMLAGTAGVAVVTTQTPGGRLTVLLGFLALWLGLTLGVLLAVLACVAALVHAVRRRDLAWCVMLFIGALLPVVTATLLVTQEIAPRHGITFVRLPAGPPTLAAVLLLVALGPLVTMIYGLSTGSSG